MAHVVTSFQHFPLQMNIKVYLKRPRKHLILMGFIWLLNISIKDVVMTLLYPDSSLTYFVYTLTTLVEALV